MPMFHGGSMAVELLLRPILLLRCAPRLYFAELFAWIGGGRSESLAVHSVWLVRGVCAGRAQEHSGPGS